MANRLLLQTLLKFSDDIKSGAAKVQDVITDYFNTTGKSVTDEERSIILKEFQDNAPSNVEEVDFSSDFLFTDKPKSTGTKAKDLSDTPGTDRASEELGMTLRGDETFGELMDLKNTKPKDQGLGSLYPKGEPGEIFDIQNDKRREVAEFMKAMRAAGIKNEDVMNVAKNPNIAEGKRAATSLARAADMAADTKVKQEALADLDDDIANYGPNWWKGEGYNDGPMGFESYGQMSRNVITKINNGIVDDLEKAGVDEEKVNFIFRNLSDVRDRLQNDPKAFVQKVADELEFEDIDYDLTFWNKYVDEILSRIQKPEPRFADGGLV